jgi:UPF0176 acylphosphatase like domain
MLSGYCAAGTSKKTRSGVACRVSDLFHDAFYRFVTVQNPEALIAQLEHLCDGAGVLGSILVAEEGINGMLCGTMSLDFCPVVRLLTCDWRVIC